MTKILAARGACLAGVLVLLATVGSSGAAAAGAAPTTESLDGPAPAFRAWLPGALAGDPAAAYKLGPAYLDGASRREDRAEAAHWLTRAAGAGHGAAQLDLAMLYGKGLGVPQDYVRSYAWFDLAAGNLEAGPRRERALELRDMMAAFMTPAERAEAIRLAGEWKARAGR